MKFFIRVLLGFTMGLLISLSLAAIAGENPVHIFNVLFKSAFGSRYDMGLALFYTTSLIFTGLSVSIAMQAGLFNIGAEGQLTIGALAATAFAIGFPDCHPALIVPSAIIIGMIAGGLWGFIPGWLQAKRGSHEVIVTMMMNFVAAAIANYVIFKLIRSEESQNPESKAINPEYMMSSVDFVQKFFTDSPANLSLVLALLLSLGMYVFLYKTVWGYELRASGGNQNASQLMGISGTGWKIFAMTAAGAVASFVSMNEIFGSAGKFRLGFSPEYGFIGIAVALLARSHPLGVVFTAFLFGVLQKGAADLDIETEMITRDFARVIQAILILSVIAALSFNKDMFRRLKR